MWGPTRENLWVAQGATPEKAVNFILSSMAVGRAIDDQGADVRERATKDLVAPFSRHHVADQGVMMGCKAWLVSARA